MSILKHTLTMLCMLKLLCACLQVLSASVVDMLQAGTQQQQQQPATAEPSTVGKATPSSTDAAPEQSSADSEAAASSPQNEADSAAGQPDRACVFEVEAVLTITGTKITPSVAQFLVRFQS